jgi:GT2 family glycosyltransferase
MATSSKRAAPSASSPVAILAVMVLYKMRPEDSPSLSTLLAAAAQVPKADLKLTIFVQDNTPGGQIRGALPPGIIYESAPHNPGLAHAYNRALEFAATHEFEWLLTLDQDTTLPGSYLSSMLGYIHRFRSDAGLAAIVPQMVDQGRNLSPFRFAAGAFPRWFPIGYRGIPDQATYALNSAALLRVRSVVSVGGYDLRFPLDVSDINLFHQLHRAGMRVYIAGDMVISHSFSLLDKGSRMSLERYRAMLMDECAFWDLNMNFAARTERFLRLIGRVCKDSLRGGDKEFRATTLIELRRRLLTGRSRRLSEWAEWRMPGRGPPNNFGARGAPGGRQRQ